VRRSFSQKSGLVNANESVCRDAFTGATLETACDEALKQISAKAYKTELKAAGVDRIIEIALAFEGRKVMMRHRATEFVK
jgi:hypothetical protein